MSVMLTFFLSITDNKVRFAEWHKIGQLGVST